MADGPTIFICYRRDDSSPHAGRLFDSLAGEFGSQNVFMDVEGLDPGDEFAAVLEKGIDSCDVFIAVLGPNWRPERLSDEHDFVRREITRALARGVRVIPVLVAGAVLPASASLPDVIKPLAAKQLFEMADRHWRPDYEKLSKTVRAELIRCRRARARKRVSRIFSRKAVSGAVAGVVIMAVLAIAISRWARHPEIVRSATTTQTAPPVPSDNGAHPLGIDLSHMSSIDWSSPGFNVLAFVFAKATQGKTGIDPKFRAAWDALAHRHLIRGAYHVWVDGADPTAQADHFVQIVKPDAGDLLAVDFEAVPFGQKIPDAQLRTDLHTFLRRVESVAHRKPLIYTSRAYWNQRMDDTFGDYPLWLADYSGRMPEAARGWQRVTMWQYGMNLPGFGDVDVNVFNGTLAELRKDGVP